MEKAGSQTSCQTGNKSQQKRDGNVASGHGGHNKGGTAGAEGTIDRQVGKIQNPVCDVHTDRHDTPDQTLGNGARHGVEQCCEIHECVAFFLVMFIKRISNIVYQRNVEKESVFSVIV